jgi:hypothetical protein
MQTACDELVALQIYQNQPRCSGVAFGMSATQGCIHGGAGSPCPLNCGMLGASRGGKWVAGASCWEAATRRVALC